MILIRYMIPLLTITLICMSQIKAEEQFSIGEIPMEQRLKDGADQLAEDQDELVADVQELIDDQTNEKVIQLLEVIEDMMNETIDELEEYNTGGETIAAQTHIIEKIFEAAQENQDQSESKSETSEAMLDMMKKMMGADGSGKEKGTDSKQQKGQGNGGQGQQGEGGKIAKGIEGEVNGEGFQTKRKVPKAAGTASATIPTEFRKALDAYNKAAEEVLKNNTK